MTLEVRALAVVAAANVAWYVRHGLAVARSGHEAPSFSAWVAYLAGVALVVGGSAVALSLLAGRTAGWPRATRAALATLLGLMAAVVFVDTWSYGTFGVHALSPATLAAATNAGASRELHLPGAFLAVALAVAALTAAAAWGLYRTAPTGRGAWWIGPALGALALTTALGLRSARAATDDALIGAAPLPSWVTSGPRVVLSDTHVTLPPPALPPPPALRPHILIVVAESLRADLLSTDGLPRLAALSQTPGCMVSGRHVSGAHTTEYGIFTLLYGLDAWHLPPMRRDAVPSPPLAAFRALGYRLEGVSASALRDWNGAAFLLSAFDHYEEHLETGGWEDDDAVRRRALAVLADAKAPTLLFVFLNGTHHNYQYPPRYERHTPVIEPSYDHFLSDDALRADADRIRNRYLNAALWVDEVAAELVHAAPQGTLAVVTGDHGEEFWDHGLLGHAAPRFVRPRVDVPFIACGLQLSAPPALSSHAQVMPTLLARLGVDASAWTSAGTLGASPVALIGGLDFPYGNPTFAAATAQGTYWLSRCRDAPLPCIEPLRSLGLDDVTPIAPLDPALLEGLSARISRFGVGR